MKIRRRTASGLSSGLSSGLFSGLSGLLAFVLCSALAAPASADHLRDHENDGSYVLLLTTLTGVGVVSTVGGIFLTVHLTSKDSSAMKGYIRRNAVALQEDLTLGAGPTVDDLAHAFGVPATEAASFGQALRSQQSTLVELIGDGDVDEARTARFVHTIQAAMAADLSLARLGS